MDAATIDNHTTAVSRAAQAAEAAIAAADAALTGTVRERMDAILALTPNVKDLEREHARLDALRFTEGDIGMTDDELAAKEAEAQERWLAALKAQSDAAADLAVEPAETAAGALERLEIYARVSSGASLDDIVANQFSLEEDVRILLAGAVASLRAWVGHSSSAAELQPPPSHLVTLHSRAAAWEVAKGTYEDAKAAYDANATAWDALWADIIAAAPPWNRVLGGRAGTTLRWQNQRQFEIELAEQLPHRRKHIEDLREPFEAWLDLQAGPLAELEQLGEGGEALYDAVCAAERLVIETPAPDLQAVAFKQRLYGREIDDEKRSYDEPASYAARRDSSVVVDAWPVWIYEDILRLSGEDHAALKTDWPTPRQWLSDFRETGGDVVLTPSGRAVSIVFPDKASDEFTAMFAELSHSRELMDAVIAHVSEYG